MMYELSKNDYKALLDLITSLSNVKTINAFSEMLISAKEQLNCFDNVSMLELEFNSTCTYKLVFSSHELTKPLKSYTFPKDEYESNSVFEAIRSGREVIKVDKDTCFLHELYKKNPDNEYDFSSVHILNKMNKDTNLSYIIVFTNSTEEGASKFDALAGYLNANLMNTYVSVTSVSDKPVEKLSERELSVLTWLKHGKTSWEVATILNITENTVNFHIKNIKNKLNATNRQHAVAIALVKNLIP